MKPPRLTYAQRERRARNAIGYALIFGSLTCMATMFYACYAVDKSHGISVSQSLAMWGL